MMVSKNQIKFVRQLEQKKFRQREGCFVAEGPKVVGDLLRGGFRCRSLFATTDWQGQYDRQEVTEEELRRLSLLQHPQQVVAVFELPAAPTVTAPEEKGLFLALDGVQDPGNLGTIIRVADWFGISRIFCSEDTADAWNPKVVQATMGSIARVSVVYTSLTALLASTSLPVYGTLLDGQNIYTHPLTADGIIVMGNEGKGISAALRPLIAHRLLIPPFSDGPESLNVAIATAITCSEFRRRTSTS